MSKKLTKTPPPVPGINRRPILMATTAFGNWHYLMTPMTAEFGWHGATEAN
ncbi:hypothetical protein BAJUN_02220 [Bajunvirus bajun]|uniref:Uncharacterized protein n=1 Tax=Brevundimonas phage vB_BgoS-Bajun TaxID=2948594 RepID=A0A9E7N774_9CAUD|nr:hypothetical protein BAJUN_02220 [Brevundimonas phage vB_BgoS-Bajun]